MIPNGLDVVVYVWVYALLALFVVHACTIAKKEESTGGEALPHVVEVESPDWTSLRQRFRIPWSADENAKFTVYEFTVFLGARFPTSDRVNTPWHPYIRLSGPQMKLFRVSCRS